MFNLNWLWSFQILTLLVCLTGKMKSKELQRMKNHLFYSAYSSVWCLLPKALSCDMRWFHLTRVTHLALGDFKTAPKTIKVTILRYCSLLNEMGAEVSKWPFWRKARLASRVVSKCHLWGQLTHCFEYLWSKTSTLSDSGEPLPSRHPYSEMHWPTKEKRKKQSIKTM